MFHWHFKEKLHISHFCRYTGKEYSVQYAFPVWIIINHYLEFYSWWRGKEEGLLKVGLTVFSRYFFGGHPCKNHYLAEDKNLFQIETAFWLLWPFIVSGTSGGSSQWKHNLSVLLENTWLTENVNKGHKREKWAGEGIVRVVMVFEPRFWT